jgi:RNA polymerase sigma-70 factor (ECF subfamily)
MNDLTRRLKAGDREAFRELVAEYGPSLRAFFAGRVSDPTVVDDLAQEAFIATWESLDRFDGGEIGAWLFGIARNRLYLYYRRTASRQRKLGELKMRILDDLVDNGREETMRRDQIVRLRDCINQLPERATELIRKRYFENVAVNDVADQLNSTAAAISCSLHRIRKQLKLCLKEAMG